MRAKRIVLALSLFSLAGSATADLEAYTDYDIGEIVSNVTTVKVDSNMIDLYLEGLSKTWKPANDIAVELGQIESYGIYVSDLPNGGDFNVILVVRFSDSSALQPSQERFEEFMEAWRDDYEELTDEIVVTYPDIRTITGEYLMREITLK